MPWFVKCDEKVVVVDSNLFKESFPSVEVASALLLCCTRRCVFTCSFSSKEKVRETISSGRATILKLWGSWVGTREERRCVRWLFVRWWSRERLSDTSLSLPGKYWE